MWRAFQHDFSLRRGNIRSECRIASEKFDKLFPDERFGEKGLDFTHARRQFLRMAQTLNEKQADLLRFLTRQSDPVPTDDLDGRIIRALKLRECIEERNGHVTVTEEGRAALEDKPQRRRRGRRPNVEKTAGHARASPGRQAPTAPRWSSRRPRPPSYRGPAERDWL
jgi:hypothetical protein